MGDSVDRLGSRRLIGRSRELGRLASAAAAASGGQGQCMLIEGEAGIGKTRLVGELCAGFHGWTVEARCYEEETSLPFAPLQTALRSLLAQASSSEDPPPARQGTVLARLLPELAEVVGPGRPGGDEGSPEAIQRALFEAAAGLFFDLADRQPLLLIFDDLHWSDDSTLAFIRFLVRRLAGHPLMLVAMYRPDPIPPSLAGMLASLQREQQAEQIVLAPLVRGDVEALLRSLFDSAEPVSPDFLDAVTAFSEGNPLYVEELVHAMVRAGDIYQVDGVWTRKALHELRVPRSVEDAVRRQSEALAPEARRVLTLASVAGREFDFDLIVEVTGLAETELVASLKELVTTGFITEERPDWFTFRHTLLREAVQGQLLARERRGLHAQVAGALEKLHVSSLDEYAAELAYHYYEAGAWERALPYARRAGEHARQLDATREAIGEFTRALDCATHLGADPMLDLLLVRAELYERAGEFDRADADLKTVLARAEPAARKREVWQTLLRLGYLWAARDYDRSLMWLERALTAASELDDPLARAESLNRIGNVFLNRDQPDRALPYHTAALETFESAKDVAGQANTLELMAVCYYNLPDVVAGAACEERALTLAREVDARSALFHSSIHLLLPLRFETEVGPQLEAERLVLLGEEALRMSKRTGWPAGEAQALGLLGGFHGLLGDYGRALPYLRHSLHLAEELEHAAGISASERMIAAVLLEILAYDEAVQRLRHARNAAAAAGAHFFTDIAALALCQALAARCEPGDLAEAEELLAELLAGDRLSDGRNAREAQAARAELDLAQGNWAAALATLEPLLASTRHLSQHDLTPVPRLALLLGRALAGSGRIEEAGEALEAAAAGARRLGRKPLQWRAHAALGRLHLDQRQRRAAQEDFDRARALVAELAGSVTDPALREGFERKALAMIPLPPAPTERRKIAEAHAGLTERERSVAALVALGRSNREIGQTLFISERTAERHVANILAKLGLNSRVQLAAWVTEHLPLA